MLALIFFEGKNMSKTGLSIVNELEEQIKTEIWNVYTVKEFETVYTVATFYTKIMKNSYLFQICDIEKLEILVYTVLQSIKKTELSLVCMMRI